MRWSAAVLQLNATSDESANLVRAEELIGEAVDQGARFVATPENTNFLGPHALKAKRAESLQGDVCARFSAMARRHGIHLLLGSFNELSPNPTKCYNTSVLFGPDGAQLAVYRKIHLFDVELPDATFRESATVTAGSEVVAVGTELGVFGLSVCYDLRFPELYRELTRQGAQILTIPSAFTATTGRHHWRALLRARAIENQCYVLAPAQVGRHDDEGLRESWGHAMVVDPWGTVVAEVPKGTGLAIAEIDHQRLLEVRQSMPVAGHRRL